MPSFTREIFKNVWQSGVRFHSFIRMLRARLSLGLKIYLSLTCILIPVFALTIFIQHKVTRPLLNEEVRQVGISVCKSLATDIKAFRLLSKPDQLDSRLIEMAWLQPSVLRIDVYVPSGPRLVRVASNIVESPDDAESAEFNTPLVPLKLAEAPETELRADENGRPYWQIIYPIREHHRVTGYIHAQVSLQLVSQVIGTFSKTAFFGDILAIGLLILILSYYVRRMIQTESENLHLTKQLHETQRQLFLNEKLAVMGQLTASFAHEIGTPLNSLSGHLQLLRDEVFETSSRDRIDVINSQVSRIEGIVKDFLASTHTPPQQRQLVDVKDLIERIRKLVAPRLAAIRANAFVSVDSNLDLIRIVPTDLEQILLNLANNAIDALEYGSNERLLSFGARSCKADGRQSLEITVQDSGDGIAPHDLKQVLKPFFTTKAPGQGTGLGLTISQRLAKRYGGRLEIESVLGKGTTIKVHIPYDAS